MKKLIALTIIISIAVLIAYSIIGKKPKEVLPVYNPIDVKGEMVDSSIVCDYFEDSVFAFRDQNNQLITQNSIKGNVFVVEYFFTTCGTICPKMNEQMQRVQEAYRKNSNIKILSFTVNPEIDTVEQMKRYSLSHKADDQQWHFLTGEKEALYDLARKSFFVLKPAEAQNLGDAGSDFIHTNNFVLIDQSMRIRGYYDGTNPKEVNKLIKHIQLVLDENAE